MFTHKRNNDCALCGTPVLARNVKGGGMVGLKVQGILLKCGCGEVITGEIHVSQFTKLEKPIPTDFVLWRVSWEDNGPHSVECWVPAGTHPADGDQLWGFINYCEMHDPEYNVKYEEVNTIGTSE